MPSQGVIYRGCGSAYQKSDHAIKNGEENRQRWAVDISEDDRMRRRIGGQEGDGEERSQKYTENQMDSGRDGGHQQHLDAASALLGDFLQEGITADFLGDFLPDDVDSG